MRLRIGTRQSPLALWQADYVAGLLTRAGHEVELVKITTAGDVSTKPLIEAVGLAISADAKVQSGGGQASGAGLFTKEIQRALIDGRCDVAVHSLKDLPTQHVPGVRLAAVPPRENPVDCLVSNEGWTIDDLPKGAVVGTGSPRRKSQLLHIRPDLVIRDIRGNVDTRLAKLHRGEYQAIVLAYAGLHRLELDASKSPRLSLDCMLPAVGQGALGIETREGDNEAFEALSLINHRESEICVRCERELLRLLHAGCLAPVAAHAILEGNTLTIRARVLSADGAMLLAVNVRESQDATGSSGDRTPERLARFAAEKLLAQGADRLIGSERSGNLGTPVFP